jgi:hypothetical protein
MARGLGVEEHSAGFAVVEKLLLEAEQGGTSRGAVTLMDVIQEVGGDGIEYQETTTQSIQDHAGSLEWTASLRTCSCSEKRPRMRRRWPRHLE